MQYCSKDSYRCANLREFMIMFGSLRRIGKEDRQRSEASCFENIEDKQFRIPELGSKAITDKKTLEDKTIEKVASCVLLKNFISKNKGLIELSAMEELLSDPLFVQMQAHFFKACESVSLYSKEVSGEKRLGKKIKKLFISTLQTTISEKRWIEERRRQLVKEAKDLQEKIEQEDFERRAKKRCLIEASRPSDRMRKIWSDEKTKDVVFTCIDGEVYAHRLMFSGDKWLNNPSREKLKENPKKRCADGREREWIDLQELRFSKRAVEVALTYFYGLEAYTEIPCSLLPELYSIARYMDMEGLQETCDALLAQEIATAQDACLWLAQADLGKNLYQKAIQILAQNFKEVKNLKAFLSLNSEIFNAVLTHSDFKEAEKDRCYAVIEWGLEQAKIVEEGNEKIDSDLAWHFIREYCPKGTNRPLIALVDFEKISQEEWNSIARSYREFLPGSNPKECRRFVQDLTPRQKKSLTRSQREEKGAIDKKSFF